jgi:predicted nucleotidyltransferase
MDSRGATSFIDDPTGAWEDLADRVGVEVPNVVAARDHTRERIATLREQLADENMAAGLSICVFGSWTREELTPESDDDWAVVAAEPFNAYDSTVVSAVETAQRYLGAEDRAPGSQKIFGVPFDVVNLVNNVGLDADTNTNLTRRMLLLFESAEVKGDVHQAARKAVLSRYMNYGIKPYRPPRFLLNDLTRYWRTICVDFEGKHADKEGADPKWVSRNAKLRISRKLLFAGGLVPILLCHLHEPVTMETFLERWVEAVPLDRLAAAFIWADAEPEGARALLAYDRWLAIQMSKDAREELRALTHENRRQSELFQDIMDIGAEFERSILALLFGTRLGPLAQQYLVF